jgi:hypothetical protein
MPFSVTVVAGCLATVSEFVAIERDSLFCH